MRHDPFRDPGRAWQPFELGHDGPWDAPRVAWGKVRRVLADGRAGRALRDGECPGPRPRRPCRPGPLTIPRP
ncbi:MAG: hypothetical protein WKF75_20940, partial [Singulisphaera sp.]